MQPLFRETGARDGVVRACFGCATYMSVNETVQRDGARNAAHGSGMAADSVIYGNRFCEILPKDQIQIFMNFQEFAQLPILTSMQRTVYSVTYYTVRV